MSLAKLAVAACAALALVAAPFDAGAKGGKGGGGKGGGHRGHSHSSVSHGSRHHHGGHARFTSVFVGSSLMLWPAAYYWPGYHPAATPVVEYWYYCQPYAAYYPYVQECPTEWQPVLPSAPSPQD